MRAPEQQDIYIHLTGRDKKRIGVAARDDGVAMSKPNPETAVRHDLGERQVRRVDIEIAFHELQIRRDLTEEFKGVAICKVA